MVIQEKMQYLIIPLWFRTHSWTWMKFLSVKSFLNEYSDTNFNRVNLWLFMSQVTLWWLPLHSTSVPLWTAGLACLLFKSPRRLFSRSSPKIFILSNWPTCSAIFTRRRVFLADFRKMLRPVFRWRWEGGMGNELYPKVAGDLFHFLYDVYKCIFVVKTFRIVQFLQTSRAGAYLFKPVTPISIVNPPLLWTAFFWPLFHWVHFFQ